MSFFFSPSSPNYGMARRFVAWSSWGMVYLVCCRIYFGAVIGGEAGSIVVRLRLQRVTTKAASSTCDGCHLVKSCLGETCLSTSAAMSQSRPLTRTTEHECDSSSPPFTYLCDLVIAEVSCSSAKRKGTSDPLRHRPRTWKSNQPILGFRYTSASLSQP